MIESRMRAPSTATELRDRYEERITALQKRLQDALAQFPVWEREMRERVEALNQAVTLSAVGLLIGELKQRFATLPAVLRHLDAVQDDVVDKTRRNLSVAVKRRRRTSPFAPLPPSPAIRSTCWCRMTMGVALGWSAATSLPAQPDRPGRIQAQSGMLSTDLTLIRPGALHQAVVA